MSTREKFSSRLGFFMVSIACAIGLGNIWLLPFRVGNYGGGAYIVLFVTFIFILGIPCLLTEFAVGRASGQTIITQHKVLQPKNNFWVVGGWLGMAGNYLLSMFYSTVVGFTLAYLLKAIRGQITGMDPASSAAAFTALTGSPASTIGWTWAVVIMAVAVCYFGLKNGVERMGKSMMIVFLVLIVILAIRSVTLPGAVEGLKFMFIPRFAEAIEKHGFFIILHTAMGQAFFSLSVGMGGMTVFASYMKKERRLLSEAIPIGLSDLTVSIICCIMIFPAAFAFGIPPGAGAGLLFVVMPNILNAIPGTYFWSILLYLCFFFVSITTLFAIYENNIAMCMDKFGWGRKKSTIINLFALLILVLPAALSFNVLNHIRVLNNQTISGLFTFLVSDNILPIGAVIYLLFVTRKQGWGWDNFVEEVNAGGKGIRLPTSIRFYYAYVMPIGALFVYFAGLVFRFR